MKIRPWLLYSIFTTVSWGIWGAVMEFPAKWGFPETLGYVTWSLTMVPCALFALRRVGWKLDLSPKSILIGSLVGLLGAGGQLLLFMALREGPAYIVFPVISLYPVLTILLSVTILKETTKLRGWIGILIALVAMAALSYQPPSETTSQGQVWILYATLVFIMWGLQAFFMKSGNNIMSSESMFAYMAATAVVLAPVAVLMTDFSQPINYGLSGPPVSFFIQILNSIGALCLVYALRNGRAIIVVPMTSLAPVITILISLAIYGVIPNPIVGAGLALASIAIYLLSLD